MEQITVKTRNECEDALWATPEFQAALAAWDTDAMDALEDAAGVAYIDD